MAEKLQGSAARVQATAVTADTIRDELLAIAKDARTAVSGGTSAWGDDEFGAKFADGDKGFVTGGSNMAQSTDKMAESFGNLVDGLTQAATKLKAMEQANADSFK